MQSPLTREGIYLLSNLNVWTLSVLSHVIFYNISIFNRVMRILNFDILIFYTLIDCLKIKIL